MELELGLKLVRVADEFTSTDFKLAKDRAGPLFLSGETDTMFILTAYLTGYQKRNIRIEINENGTRIAISGEKAVQETVMVGWGLHKKETEIRVFRKAFKIPDGVILDKVRAKFDEDESKLTVLMPKKEKGIRGVDVEEVKEHELARGGSETLQINGHAPEIASKEPRGNLENVESAGVETAFPEETEKKSIHDLKEQAEKEEQRGQNERLQKVAEEHERIREIKSQQDEATQGSEEPSVKPTGKAPVVESTDGLEGEMHREELKKEEISEEVEGNTEEEQKTDEDHGKESDIKANEEKEEEESAVEKAPEVAQEDSPTRAREERGKFKICTPIVAGSALLLSIVVFVIQFIRTKSQPGKRKE